MKGFNYVTILVTLVLYNCIVLTYKFQSMLYFSVPVSHISSERCGSDVVGRGASFRGWLLTPRWCGDALTTQEEAPRSWGDSWLRRWCGDAFRRRLLTLRWCGDAPRTHRKLAKIVAWWYVRVKLCKYSRNHCAVSLHLATIFTLQVWIHFVHFFSSITYVFRVARR